MNSETTIITIIASMITALSSAKAWDFWNKRQSAKIDQDNKELKEKTLYRDDLKVEVERLRKELIELYAKREIEIKQLNELITNLSEELSGMRVRVEFLERENADLRRQIEER